MVLMFEKQLEEVSACYKPLYKSGEH